MERRAHSAAESEPEPGATSGDKYGHDGFSPGEFSATALPSDRRRTPQSPSSMAAMSLSLGSDAVASATRLAEGAAASIESVLFCVFAGMVHWLTQQQSVLVGALPAKAPGKLLPMHLPVAPGMTLRQLVERSDAALREGTRHPESLAEALPSADQLGTARPTTFFGYATEAVPPPNLQTDLVLQAVHTPLDLTLNSAFNSELFDRSTIERWLLIYRAALVRWGANTEIALADAFALTDVDRALLASFNATSMALEVGLRIEVLIKRQVAATPDAIAITAGGVKLSFRELAQRANGLTEALQARGVRAGDLVGLSCDRNEHMVVALYGILQAGAGYVPLDPSFPPDRLDFMAGDAGFG